MAQNLSVTWTLSAVKANIRDKTRTLSTQEFLVLEPQLNDIVHFAIQTTRAIVGKFLDPFYTEKKTDFAFTGTMPNYTGSIAAQLVSDVLAIRLYQATLKEIPIVSNVQFNALRTVYSATDIGATRGFATVYLTAATPSVLTIALFSNIAAAPTAVELSYPRNPIKVITDADTIDIPDQYVPTVINAAARDVFLKLGKQPPSELEATFAAQLNAQLAQYNLQVSPQKA